MSVGKLWRVFMYTVEGMCAAYNTHGKADAWGDRAHQNSDRWNGDLYFFYFALLF